MTKRKPLSRLARVLTAERLHELLKYEPDTGLFIWRIRVSNIQPGSFAGTPNDSGYTNIRIDGRAYRAHRLAWLYVYGEWPNGTLDHKNGQRKDNRISNLREATQAQNIVNARRRSDNRSGYKGVKWHPAANKWQAQIIVRGKRHHLGVFADPAEAHAAYCAAAAKFYGEFARAG